MQLLPLHKLGAHERPDGSVEFGLFLPWVSAANGNRMWVKIIHEHDQFLQHIPPLRFEMSHAIDPEYGDYWSVRVDLRQHPPPHPASAWGQPGRYVFYYSLQNPNTPGTIDWIIDPFAREFGVGRLSAFTLGYQPYTWSNNEQQWKTPVLHDLVIYELMLSEFAGSSAEATSRLDYLADLGVNCIELMPVSNVANEVEWGYLPIGYFGVDERFGKRRDMQQFIDAAHQRGIAVISDVVYGHTSDLFPYVYVYRHLGYRENPFMGSFGKDYFGESTDFGRKFTRDFFFTVNHHWLDVYHLDGFRYDCVPNFWDGALGQGYAQLTYETYQLVQAQQGSNDHWQRFFDQGQINLIQCAEQLEDPVGILYQSYSNCTWQNETYNAAQSTAHGRRDSLSDLGLRLGLFGYPDSVSNNGDTLPKTALQYIENHDHSRFVSNFGTIWRGETLLGEGNRDLWYKVQPYLIGLLTAQGIPLLWQGQEFGENYLVPPAGIGRSLLFRPVRWDYFYDPVGRALLNLVRKLLELRHNQAQFRRGSYYFHNHYDHYQSRQLLLFSRSLDSSYSLVALNFSDQDQTLPFTFPHSGSYREELHSNDTLADVTAGVEHWLTIPSNYGRIWTLT